MVLGAERYLIYRETNNLRKEEIAMKKLSSALLVVALAVAMVGVFLAIGMSL